MADSFITFTPGENHQQARNDEGRGPCPIHKGEGDNLSMNPETGDCSVTPNADAAARSQT
jgi:hypothetical protein